VHKEVVLTVDELSVAVARTAAGPEAVSDVDVTKIRQPMFVTRDVAKSRQVSHGLVNTTFFGG
jgi:hypothetical protein